MIHRYGAAQAPLCDEVSGGAPKLKKLQAIVVLMAALLVAGMVGGLALAKSAPTVKIAVPTWTGYGPLFLAKDKGFFDKYGVSVDLTIIEGLGERKQALATNRLQAMATALDVQVTLAAADVPIKVVWALDDSFGGDGILAKTAIKSVKDLQGKRVAFHVGSTSHLFLLTVLAANGMSQKDIVAVNMTAGEAGAAFVAGRVDAAVTWEPWLTKGEQSGQGKVLLSTKDFPGIIADSVSFRADYVRQYPEAVKGFVAAMKDAMDYWKQHEDEGNAVMAKGLGISKAEFVETMGGLKFHDFASNLRFFGTPGKPGPIYGVMGDAADFYMEQKIIDRKPVVADMIDSSFLQALR